MASSAGAIVVYIVVGLGVILAVARLVLGRAAAVPPCAHCGHRQPEGTFCEECGRPLSREPSSSGRTDPAPVVWWERSPVSRSYWRGASRERPARVAAIVLGVMWLVNIIHDFDDGALTTILGGLVVCAVGWILFVGIFAWVRRRKAMQGGIVRGLAVLFVGLGIAFIVLSFLLAPGETDRFGLYVGLGGIAIGLVLFAVSWVAVQARKKAERDDLLRQTVQAIGDTSLAPKGVPATAGTPSVASELRDLADLHGRGVLTAEEFQKAKERVLGTPETEGRP